MAGGRGILVLGGARSGKSTHARTLAEASGLAPVMIATAQAHDAEMAERIARHRAERDARWHTREAPQDLIDALREEARPGRTIVVDCVTLWLSNLMLADADTDAAIASLVDALREAPCPVALVSNEVGSGIVPAHELGRRFRDLQGRANQALAAAADEVVLVVAGIPLTIKAPRGH